MTTQLNADECWRAVQRRDASRDGQFVYGVVTTGVFCRPSCPGRTALRRNIRFYATPADAERDGLRACLRCRPLAEAAPGNSARIHQVCRYIEQHSADRLPLRELSGMAGLSPFHFQRVFRSIVGLTPRQYVEAVRMRNLKTGLRQAHGVADAVYEAGFGSSSRVYERADTRLGMTPCEYRAGGRDLSITCVTVKTPHGLLGIGATDRGLCFVQFGESREKLMDALRREYPEAAIDEVRSVKGDLEEWVKALQNHLAGAGSQLDLPLDIRATAFQMRVWRYLQTIPPGETRSYAEVARGIGRPGAARAVAQACAGNTVAVVIPCHRVIRGNGAIGGYRWGVARKEALLAAERG